MFYFFKKRQNKTQRKKNNNKGLDLDLCVNAVIAFIQRHSHWVVVDLFGSIGAIRISNNRVKFHTGTPHHRR